MSKINNCIDINIEIKLDILVVPALGLAKNSS